MANKITHHEEFYRGENYVDELNKVRGVICGAGALGSNLAETLLRQGWTNFLLIDMDRVEVHNIGTQIYDEEDVGQLKVAACQSKFIRICGDDIDITSNELTSKNVKKLLKNADLVIDAFDNSESRQLLQTHCRDNDINCLHAGLNVDYGEVVWDEKYLVPGKTEGDVCDYPLARNLISIIVSIAAEEVLDFCLAKNPRRKNWSVTLKDLKIGSYI